MCYLFNLCGMIEEFIVKDCMSKYFVECQNVMKVSFWGEMSPRSAYWGGSVYCGTYCSVSLGFPYLFQFLCYEALKFHKCFSKFQKHALKFEVSQHKTQKRYGKSNDTLGTQNHLKLPLLGVNQNENTFKVPTITNIRNFEAIG